MHFLLEPLLRLFAALVSRGGEPRLDRDRFGAPVLVYSLRPGTLAFFLGCAVFSAYTLAVNLPLLLHHGIRAVHAGQLGFGIFCGAAAALMLPRNLTLDDTGLRLRTTFGRIISIPFADMHHVERYNSSSAGKATWFLRSNPNPATGRDTTITLPEMTYNVDHLLREIRERVPLPELPRRKRHWYGG